MTIPKDVQGILESWDVLTVDHDPDGWPAVRMREMTTIRAHLISQDAEIERSNGLRKQMRASCKKAKREVEWMRDRLAERDISLSTEIQVRAEAESRLAAANALLCEAIEWNWLDDGWPADMEALDERIQSHLQGAGDEA